MKKSSIVVNYLSLCIVLSVAFCFVPVAGYGMKKAPSSSENREEGKKDQAVRDGQDESRGRTNSRQMPRLVRDLEHEEELRRLSSHEESPSKRPSDEGKEESEKDEVAVQVPDRSISQEQENQEKVQEGNGEEEPGVVIEGLVLPPEMWAYIFSNGELPLPALMKMQGVCKGFKALIGNSVAWPPYMVHLFQQMYGKNPWEVKFSKEELEAFNRLYQKMPWELMEIPVVKCMEQNPGWIGVKTCPLSSFIPCGDIIWATEIEYGNDWTLGQLGQFPNLFQLSLQRSRITDVGLQNIANYCPNLTSLSLGNCKDPMGAGFLSIADKCKKLTALSMSGCTGIRDYSFLKAFLGLRELYLPGTNITDKEIKSITEWRSDLTALDIACCSNLTEVSLRRIADCYPGLRKLRLGSPFNSEASVQAIRYIAERCPNLTELDLHGCQGVDDACVEYIARQCPNLTSLCLGLTQVSPVGVQAVLDHCPHLAKLSLYKARVYSKDILSIEGLSRLQEITINGQTRIETLKGKEIGKYIKLLQGN